MMYELKFADIGEGIHEGEILEWHVKVGDNVKEDQTIAEVNTEKVNVEITSPVEGVVETIEKDEGTIVEVGEVLARIETGAVKEASSSPPKGEKLPKEKDDSLFTPTVAFKETETEPRKRTRLILAAPAVRRKAREMGIELAEVKGSGPGGRILFPDLEAHSKKPKKGPARVVNEMPANSLEEHIPVRGIRRAIVQNMSKSKHTAAHFSYFDEVDMTALDRLKEEAEALPENQDVKMTYLPLIIKSLIPTLREFPMLNASLDDENEEIVVKHYYNIGIAVDTEDGLMVPVIKDADKKDVWQLAREIDDLATRARNGKLNLDEVKGGTFTITSVGNIGGVMATPILRWPEVGILGIMRGKLRPVVIEEHGEPKIAIRKMMFLSISIDHRVVDGATVARFTNRLIQYLENPGLILLRE
jgi:pyruvate dehydrogenase E2 component (dihydrolipoamide acetyltransferase)